MLGSTRGRELQRVAILGCIGVGPRRPGSLPGTTVCPLSSCTWKGAAVGRQEPPHPLQSRFLFSYAKNAEPGKALGR